MEHVSAERILLVQLPSKKEKRHREFVERVELIGRDFAENKERLIYFEKLAAFKQELRDVQDGTHQEFSERVALLEFERKAAIRKAELFRNYQLECANAMYQAEKEAYDQEYLLEKQGLREKILSQLEDRRKKLKEDRDYFDASNEVSDSNKAMYTRKTTRAQAAKLPDDKKEGRFKAKGKASTGPILPIQIKDHELYDDLTILKRSTRG
ncbi:Sin3 histone deacetylase corepressor complex component SDS3 [Physocladia obscura]|uniref:Sin3 histone deacetylase corepressor complex component SDS3 n=1 Tax=Physocladia obscura TaxID=109957 RepID=A0AAD5SWT6_9FUNG|nr:Sin3 histone deacetylase corepressor complex component SDS3 [Physocladia obscura]